jgi:hypothetical protein
LKAARSLAATWRSSSSSRAFEELLPDVPSE